MKPLLALVLALAAFSARADVVTDWNAAALGGLPDAAITIADSADSKILRHFPGIAKLAEEQRLVRIWGGIHFRTSVEVSDRMGQALVKHLAENTFRPVR